MIFNIGMSVHKYKMLSEKNMELSLSDLEDEELLNFHFLSLIKDCSDGVDDVVFNIGHKKIIHRFCIGDAHKNKRDPKMPEIVSSESEVDMQLICDNLIYPTQKGDIVDLYSSRIVATDEGNDDCVIEIHEIQFDSDFEANLLKISPFKSFKHIKENMYFRDLINLEVGEFSR